MRLRRIGKQNATEVDLGGKVVLYSYSTPVAVFLMDGGVYFRTKKFFSKTTSKHINHWIGDRDVELIEQSELEEMIREA